jgi:hypothetical protein
VHLGAGASDELDDRADNAFVLEGALEMRALEMRALALPQGSLLKRERGAPCPLRGGPTGTTLLAWRDP